MNAADEVAPSFKKTLITPEGVALEFRIPDLGERLGAFTIDFAFAIISMMILQLIAGLFLLIGLDFGGLTYVVAVVGAFLIWNGYYIWFECRPRGATPGKRRVGLRVIDRRGGPLRPSAVVARNLVRNFEFVVPLVAINQFLQAGYQDNVGKICLALAFLVACGISPIFHRDRLRPGDWIAGTVVVANPKSELMQDLGRARTETTEHDFSREHLAVYGVYELQVLEDLLRAGSQVTREKAQTVAMAIKKKIVYEPEIGNPKNFLREFYAAQRAFLERDLALGRRKESKLDGAKSRPKR